MSARTVANNLSVRSSSIPGIASNLTTANEPPATGPSATIAIDVTGRCSVAAPITQICRSGGG